MSIGRQATHWSGPLEGDDRASGGLFEDISVVAMGLGRTAIWHRHFLDTGANPLAQDWTTTSVVGGTVTIPQANQSHMMQLAHGTADQGPSVQAVGTDGPSDAIAAPAANTPSQAVGLEFRVRHNTNVATNDAFIGFTTAVAAHPLLAAGTLNTAGVADGVGFHWLDANDGRPVMVAWRANTAETLVNPPTLSTSVVAEWETFGIRIDSGATQPKLSFYRNHQRVFRHLMSAAFNGRMTICMGLISNAAGAQFQIDYVTAALQLRNAGF